MKQLKSILNWIGKNIYLYIIVFALIIFSAITRTIVPQFGSYALDSILSDKPSVLPSLFDEYIQRGDNAINKTFILIIIMMIFQTVRALVMFLSRVVYAKASENTTITIRNKLYRHLQKLPYSFYKQRNAGDIIQRCTTDMDTIRTFLGDEVHQLVWILSMIIATVVQMVMIDPVFALISLCIFPFILLISVLYFKKTYVIFNDIDEKEGEMIDVIKENVMGVQVVKAFGSQKFEFEKYNEKSGKYYDSLKILFSVLSKLYGATTFLTSFQVFIIMVVGVIFVNNGQTTVGTLVLFLSYTKLLSYPINILARLITRLGKNFVAVDRINEILESEVESVEGGYDLINGNISFKNVSFAYPDSNINVLKDVSFDINVGEKVGIVGRTGSGKSTISYLLARLFEPTTGNIYINEVNISNINKNHLRNNIGIVVQEPYLFSRDITENINIKGNNFDMDNIIFYAKVANIHDDIAGFEQGYDTEVGERGTTLSGGQKQRIAIARMLINDYKVLVFDDSLSAVDNETDMSIRQALSNIENVTTITITHRVTSILDYDKVIVLDDGEIVEYGTVEKLKNSDGYFAKIYLSQVGDNNE